jgi:hypothetical protein
MDISFQPLNEIILRLYENPSGLKGRELIKKTCLGIGILNPGDSRDVIVDVFWVITKSSKQQKWLSSIEIGEEVIQLRKSLELSTDGTAGSNIRRILKILCDYGIVENIKAKYRIIEFMPLEDVFERVLRERFEKIVDRNKMYLRMI